MGSQKQSKYPELAGENSLFLSLILAASTGDGETTWWWNFALVMVSNLTQESLECFSVGVMVVWK